MTAENLIVAKFGGSSMAEGRRIESVAEIVRSNKDRRFVVVSAPGKRNSSDEKITDILFQADSLAQHGLPFDQAFDKVSERFSSIGRELQCYSVFNWLEEINKGIGERRGRDWSVSRGEWLMAKVFAEFLHGSFIDAANLIQLKQNGQISSLSYDIIKNQLTSASVYYVIPGFYGADDAGRIKIFARGGSDITGAIIARGINATLYENWTDVNGLRSADPRIVSNSKIISEITYTEMRELGYRGVEVLQKDTIVPVFEAGIPINIRNTFNSGHPGTKVVKERISKVGEGAIGIAGKAGFMAFQIDKFGMNEEVGIGSLVLEVFKDEGVSFEHDPSGLDSISIIVDEKELNGKEKTIIDNLQKAIKPDRISLSRNLGLICVVGQNIKNESAQVAGLLFKALKDATIPIRMINYGASGMNIVVGVDGDVVNDAIKILYESLVS